MVLIAERMGRSSAPNRLLDPEGTRHCRPPQNPVKVAAKPGHWGHRQVGQLRLNTLFTADLVAVKCGCQTP